MSSPLDAPILDFDALRDAVIEPARTIEPFDLPAHVVLCFFRDAIASFVEELGGREIGRLVSEMGSHPVFEVDLDGRRLAIAQAGVGAPLAAGWLDELIALGGRAFIAAGGAGVLVPDLAMGHVVVPTAAIRDEGTSYHYLPASREVAPTDSALSAIIATLDRHGVPHVAGKTWTTDALYRETREKVRRRVAEGCLTVEMEAAAFFAVARFRGVSFGQMLYAGDDLSGEAWDGRGWPRHDTGRSLLLRLAAEAVLRIEVDDTPSSTHWEAQARNWAAWTRGTQGDAYGDFAPRFLALLPPPDGLALEVGCGEGRVCRDLAAAGYAMTGVDIAPTLVELARKADPTGTYLVADASSLPFRDGSFRLVVAYNSLMDVDDLPGAVREAARVLEPGGRLCVCVTHPIADAGGFRGDEGDAPFVIDGSYLGRRRFESTVERNGITMEFRGWAYPLETYFRALEDAGLLVETVREPAAVEGRGPRTAAEQRWSRLPNFLFLRAVKLP